MVGPPQKMKWFKQSSRINNRNRKQPVQGWFFHLRKSAISADVQTIDDADLRRWFETSVMIEILSLRFRISYGCLSLLLQ
ncbi:hypothetical protein CVU37_09515 [candidate division BRC1 bacterium HGW-BRC1-1]|nr:MAG: hypothetical protein CVU37_09515 [candidate division BRC1 bacterium HGW-BRC1-1]